MVMVRFPEKNADCPWKLHQKCGDFSWDFHGQLHSQLRRRRFRCQVLKSAMASLPSDADVLYLGYSQATLTAGQNVGEN